MELNCSATLLHSAADACALMNWAAAAAARSSNPQRAPPPLAPKAIEMPRNERAKDSLLISGGGGGAAEREGEREEGQF